MENKSLCIEDIMQEIRNEIKEKNLTADMLSFEDVPYKKAGSVSSANNSISDEELSSAMVYLNSHYNIQPYKELSGNPLAVFVKKVIRKLTKFYVEPVVFEQNDFNANVVSALNSMLSREGSSADNDGLAAKIEALELKQKNMTIEIEALRRENRTLREELGKQGK